MSREQAVEIARVGQPDLSELTDAADASGLAPGERIVVRADDYGRDAITGTLLRSSADEVTLVREHEEVGRVAVHFPRAGFAVARAVTDDTMERPAHIEGSDR